MFVTGWYLVELPLMGTMGSSARVIGNVNISWWYILRLHAISYKKHWGWGFQVGCYVYPSRCPYSWSRLPKWRRPCCCWLVLTLAVELLLPNRPGTRCWSCLSGICSRHLRIVAGLHQPVLPVWRPVHSFSSRPWVVFNLRWGLFC